MMLLNDVAAALGIRPDTLRQYILSGRVEAQKIGLQWFIPKDELQRLLLKKRRRERKRNKKLALENKV